MGSVSRSKSFNFSTSTGNGCGGGGGGGGMLFTRPIKFPFPHLPPTSSSLSRSYSRGTKYGYLGQHMGPPGSSGSSNSSGSSGSGGGGIIGGPSSISHGSGVSKINPNKTTATISGLQGGLKGAIQLLLEEISKNNCDLQGQQNSKSLTLQLKTLEYQLSRLDSLEEEYSLQQRLREGVRNMAYAYTLSTGHHQKLALANVKAGFRECTETLGALEGQLQEFLGAFHLSMKGIQGFARLCPGDVYEIVVKHGAQKWKSRTKVSKDGAQEWDFPSAKILPLLGQDLFIKAAEVKTLGKQVLLGNKFCEICHLFSAHPQLMTVNLNPSGSLKLNLMVEWEPLAQFYHGGGGANGANNGSVRGTPHQDAESPLRKRRMLISPIGSCSGGNNGNNSGSRNRRHTASPYSSSGHHDVNVHTLSPSPSPSRGQQGQGQGHTGQLGEELRENLAKLSSILNDEIQGQYPELEVVEVNVAALRRLAFQEWPDFSRTGGVIGGGGGSCRSRASSSSHHPLHNAHNHAYPFMMTSASNSSLNIASALEAFDFLDAADELVSSPQGEEPQRPLPPPNSNANCNANFLENSASLRLHPVEEESSTKVTPNKTPSAGNAAGTLNSDSGISSLASTSSRSPSPGESSTTGRQSGRQSQIKHGVGPSTCGATSPYVTGSEELDLVLHTHVILCLKQVNSLGSFGPLKCKEKAALCKLHQQGVILGNILHRIRINSSTGQPTSGGGVKLTELEGHPLLSSLWREITGTNLTTLVTTADLVSFGLEAEIRKFLDEEEQGEAPHLAKTITIQMLDEGGSGIGGQDVDTSALFQLLRHVPLTLFQFLAYLKPYQASFPRLVNDIAEEELLTHRLSDPRNVDEVAEILGGLSSVPPTPVFLPLIRLLSHQNPGIRGEVQEFLQGMAQLRRRELVENCLELLEWEEGSAREASLSVLELVMAPGGAGIADLVLEEVAYLAQTDPEGEVREVAKRILNRNKEGRRTLAQLTLNSHGFQGLLAN